MPATPTAPPDDVLHALDGIRRVVRALRVAAAGAESATGLTSSQLFVLQAVCSAPGSSLSEVATRTMTDRTSVAAVVERLEAQGLVVRARSTTDQRRVEVTPTPRAARVLARAPHPPTRRLLDALSTMHPTERRRLARGLTALVDAMGLSGEPATMLFDEPTHGMIRARGKGRRATANARA